MINPSGISKGPYAIDFTDPVMDVRLSDFEDKINERTYREYPGHGYVYHHVIEIR